MSPGSERVDFGDISEILKGVESGSADNAQSDWFCKAKLVNLCFDEQGTIETIRQIIFRHEVESPMLPKMRR